MLAWFSMLPSLLFGMQHDNVLKKFNFDPRVEGGLWGKIFANELLHS